MYSWFGFFSLTSICDTFLVGEAVIIITAGQSPTVRTYDRSSIPLVVSGSGLLQVLLLRTFLCVYAFLFVYNQE